MSSEDSPISAPVGAAIVPVEQLQFRHAEPVGEQAASRRCAGCKSPIYSTYFQTAGRDICEACAGRIQRMQQAPPAHALLQAALYGGGAAIAGCAIYAAVAILAHLELALIAILIGYMVGKAVRKGSNGLGGRPQQILAVLLTYFAITFSYVAVFIYNVAQHAVNNTTTAASMNVAQAVVSLVVLAAIAPFLALGGNFVGGAISLLIIFFGLRQAWALTGRTDLQIFGPYSAT